MKNKPRAQKSLIVLSLCLSLVATPAQALNESTLDRFEQNGIYYYNPSGQATCRSTSTTLTGNTLQEKTWNFFISQGFNDAQTAGILGNAQIESTFSPTRASNTSYWGLFQWGGGRKTSIESTDIGNPAVHLRHFRRAENHAHH